MMNNTSYQKKTGILGGTFNPIHTGHLMLAENALEYCKLDEVLIMPSGCSYFKDQSTVASVTDRINMTKLAIDGNDKLVLSTIETERTGNSYTYETLDILCRQDSSIRYYYIIGADTLFSMETWLNPGDIFSKCTVICAKRDGYSDDKMAEQKKRLESMFGADIILMDIPEVPISSSMIRRLMSDGYSCRYYIPDKVLEYIKEKGLYGFDRN